MANAVNEHPPEFPYIIRERLGERLFIFAVKCSCQKMPFTASETGYATRHLKWNARDLKWSGGTQITDPVFPTTSTVLWPLIEQ